MSDTSTSEATTTPESAPQPAAPANAGEARALLKQKLAREMAGKRAAAPKDDDEDAPVPKPAKKEAEPKAEPKNTDEPKSKVEARIELKEDALEEAGVKVPDQRKGESDSKYELRLAQLLAEKESLIRERDKFGGDFKKLQKLIDAGKANPMTILDHLGLDLEKLIKGLNPNDPNFKKEWTNPKKGQATLPQEVMDRIAALEKDKNDAVAKAQAAELEKTATARFEKDSKKISSFLDANAEEFPILASLDWGAGEVVRQCNAKGVTDAGPIIRALEENLENNMERMVSSDKAMKKAFSKNPELKAVLKKYFEGDAPAKKKSDDEDEVAIKGVSDLVNEPPARSTKRTREDVKASLAAELKAKKRKAVDDED